MTLEVEDTNNNAPSLHINLLQLNQNKKGKQPSRCGMKRLNKLNDMAWGRLDPLLFYFVLVFLSESTPIDTYVGYVIASDGDSGRNGEVVLNIETTSGK